MTLPASFGGWRDALQVGIVAALFYRVLVLLHGTRAMRAFGPAVALVALYAVAWAFDMPVVAYVVGRAVVFSLFAGVVVFQPELRQILVRLGQARVTRVTEQMEQGEVADQVAEAVDRLSRSGIGAIIAIERDAPLSEFIESGSELQATVSADLLATIFTPYSPLHDGAVLLRGDTIVGAGCILPLSQGPLADRSLGTRHRAALGLSEETDALVLIVSEESSTVSAAVAGRLQRGLGPAQVRDLVAGRPARPSSEIAAVRALG